MKIIILINLVIFPFILFYLMFVIIKGFKDEIKILNLLNKQQALNLTNELSDINNSLLKIIDMNEQMHNYLNNYLNNLLSKLLDVLDDFDKY